MLDNNPVAGRTRTRSSGVPARPAPICVGVIEVGSRALRPLVADISRGSGLVRVWTDSIEYQIGSLGVRMTPESLAKLRESIGWCKEKAVSLGAKKIMIFGTAAVRDLAARRNFDFTEVAAEIEILDQRTEAFYSLVAAVKGLPGHIQDSDSVLVMDQGARSFEIAIGKAGRDICLTNFASLELGSENLIQLFQECRWNMRTFKHKLSDEFKRLILPVATSVDRVVGFGSVATNSVWQAVREYERQPYDARRVHGKSLTVGDIDGMITRLGRLSPEQLARLRTNIDPRNPTGRGLEQFVTGLTAFREFLRYFGKDRFLVSADGTRYGAAWQLALSQSSCAKSTCRA